MEYQIVYNGKSGLPRMDGETVRQFIRSHKGHEFLVHHFVANRKLPVASQIIPAAADGTVETFSPVCQRGWEIARPLNKRGIGHAIMVGGASAVRKVGMK